MWEERLVGDVERDVRRVMPVLEDSLMKDRCLGG